MLLGVGPAGTARRNIRPRSKADRGGRGNGVNVLSYATNREPKYKLDLPQLANVGRPRRSAGPSSISPR